ncbi:MAG TPA: hypothetical protein VG013_12950 [Gemmataceae bacterium]|jgi:hypothetical protein|nr:hypothetical protein [Gemmataceae bacterium]
MALNNQARGRGWSRLHLLARMAGLTGLVVAAAGLVLMAVSRHAPGVSSVVGVALAVGGGIVALLALLLEIRQGMSLVTGQRGALGSSVVFQVLLAAALLVGANVFSFLHYARLDWTRDHLFTIPDDDRRQLSDLKDETTVVVYLPHRTFGQQTDKPDDIEYDTAAEHKVVEKVRDLVDQFQELGPQFKVVVLDVQEKKGYRAKLAEIKEEAPLLKEAIDKAKENSIFFYADGKVQELGFEDVYELDKPASKQADDGHGNLVLYSQGIGPFARRVLRVDEKRPRVAIGVVHPALSLEGEEVGMAGLKKVLAERGFDSRDVILKKWPEERGLPEPAVFTYDEDRYESLEGQRDTLKKTIEDLDKELEQLAKLHDHWRKASLEALTKEYADQLDGHKVTEEIRQRQLSRLETVRAIRQLEKNGYEEESKGVAKEIKGLNVEGESLAERRRISDLRAKTNRMLADCDLLILPRHTLINVAQGEGIPSWLHSLAQAQVEAIKDFLKAGKPVLFCFGPVNDAPTRSQPPPELAPDKLESLVDELGIKLARQTVLFNVESKAFAQRRGNLLIVGSNIEPPAVEFDWQPGAGQPLDRPPSAGDKTPNPIRESLLLTARSLGKDQPMELRLRQPRPVYCKPEKAAQLDYQPEFMMTSPASWNEEQPWPVGGRAPRYEPRQAGGFTLEKLDEKRRGPFPIAVAIDTEVPRSWYDDKDAKPAKVRVAAIGHGGLFIGPTLSPIKEKLFLDVSNWLLGRDDRLARKEHPWQYPRVSLSTEGQQLWQWGTRLGLPVLFIYFGLLVLLVRRLR